MVARIFIKKMCGLTVKMLKLVLMRLLSTYLSAETFICVAVVMCIDESRSSTLHFKFQDSSVHISVTRIQIKR